MKKYTIVFTGCKKGSLGIRYQISAFRSAESEEKALLSLYDDYEHISNPKIWERFDDGR